MFHDVSRCFKIIRPKSSPKTGGSPRQRNFVELVDCLIGKEGAEKMRGMVFL